MKTSTLYTQETQDRISTAIDNAIVDIIVSNTGAMPDVISNGATHDEYLASYNEALGYLNSAETVFGLSVKNNALLLSRHNVLNMHNNPKTSWQDGVDSTVDNVEELIIEILGIINKIDNLMIDANEESLAI